MFTGIVKEIGRVKKAAGSGSSIKLGIESAIVSPEAAVSDSISVNGACLTLTSKNKNLLLFDAISSTLKNTNLKRLKDGDFVNLEPALSLGEKVGGHFVLGHIDAELKVRRLIKKAGHWELEIDLPSAFRKNVVVNGSVAIEGISLTIKKVLPRTFSVDIIPFTHSSTTLKYKKIGDFLNIEFDYLLKKNNGA
ncbi:MAG: riboflavin synthase [Candidatus Omnitrophica bacterium]|nr:riboflavin synthase [Candidatus Omnitrophota bacterium]